MSRLQDLLGQHLANWQSGWSMGTFGAIAEFHQDLGEIPVIDDPARLTRATRRGGVRIEPTALANIVPVAYETLSPKRHRWSQALALCLPEHLARRPARQVLTEIGPDDNAIRGIDRTGILFDMGLSLPQCDFCVRTSDPKLLGVLRANLGLSVMDPANHAMAAILSAHPHRVALTNIGRVEVYQKIGGPDTGGVSPAGPHTHVLPKLLKGGRTHSANTPIPVGLLPVGSLHPGNPVSDEMGQDRPFDQRLHSAFQSLLKDFGIAEAVAVKSLVEEVLRNGKEPDETELPATRLSRTSVRMALRQQEHVALSSAQAELLALIGRWRNALEGTDDSGEEDDAPGH